MNQYPTELLRIKHEANLTCVHDGRLQTGRRLQSSIESLVLEADWRLAGIADEFGQQKRFNDNP